MLRRRCGSCPSTGSAALQHHRLARRHLRGTAAVALVAAVLAVGNPATAFAEAASDPVDAAREAVDDVALRWFAAQADADETEERLAAVEQRVARAEAKAAATRKIATARALQIYKGPGSTFVTLLDGNDALESARRVELIDRANADSDAAIDELAGVTDDLRAEQDDLRASREHQQEVLAELDSERRNLEAALDDAVTATIAEDALRAATAADVEERAPEVAAPAPPSPLASATAPDTAVGSAASVPTGPVGEPATAAPTAGRHPRHDEPFLVCTRGRESGGNYAAVNPAGYYGAYQFSPLTWDTTASHAGRLELVGVLPSRSSEYDQDELAWVLYQWQGNTPWGGRC